MKPSKNPARNSESAPRPILGHTADGLLRGILTGTTTLQALRHKARLPRSDGIFGLGGCAVLARGVGAVPPPPDTARRIPFLVVAMAGVAGAGGDAVRVEAGIYDLIFLSLGYDLLLYQIR